MRNTYEDDHKKFGLAKNKPPAVTTTLVVDNTAYISSSANGAGSFLYLPNGNTRGRRFNELDPAHPCTGPVQDALVRCQAKAVTLGSGHRTGASCGEPMAALAFCATNNQRDLANAKIVTIVGKTAGKIVPPCGNPAGHLVRPSQLFSTSLLTLGLGIRWRMGLS